MTTEVVTSRSNARVKQLRAAFAGQARLASGLVAIEGEHLLEEAVKSQQALKTVFVSERRELPTFVPRGIEVVRLANDVFQSCVETQTPQGIAALLVPRISTAEEMLGPGLTGSPLILIAVGLQGPGNLGTLVRSAEAFGATGVLTTLGTVSAWNQKALRASAGSVFRMPVTAATPEVMERLEQAGVQLVAALKDDASAVDSPDLEDVLRGPRSLDDRKRRGWSERGLGENGRPASDNSLPWLCGESQCRGRGFYLALGSCPATEGKRLDD